ncbi:MAG: DUF4337 domain-containing protein [Chroococcidiopsidaceae cyanobacterium CP_BM_RX_35]|nr:DUF4337 domain-containing protein [Chroococcidiopsidaceae cyanobacterium CP_BM_RX_35]
MPEETETKTLIEEFEEANKEKKEESGFFKRVSFSTAIIAVIAAIAGLESGSTINMALSNKNDAVAAYTQASDQWAYYQAKGIKATVLESQKSLLTSLGKPTPVKIGQEIERYKKEQKTISQKASNDEKLSERYSQEAERLIEQHHGYAYSVAILQISVALSAISALAKNRNLWILSIMVALLGTYFVGNSFFLKESAPAHDAAVLK